MAAQHRSSSSRLLENSTTVRNKLLLGTFGVAARAVEPVSPKLAGRLARQLLTRPLRAPSTRAEGIFASATVATVDSIQGAVRIWRWGMGPTVLLVHGWEGRAAQLGEFVPPLVRAGYSVLAVDLPGHGDSAGPHGDAWHAALALVDLAREVGPLHGVIAHSMGALATNLALWRGFAAERFAYVSPAGAPDEAVALIQRMFALSDATAVELRASIIADGAVTWDQLRAGGAPPDTNKPLLVHHDTADSVVPIGVARELATGWAGAEVVETTGLGHNAILRDPRVIARVVEHITVTESPAGRDGEETTPPDGGGPNGGDAGSA